MKQADIYFEAMKSRDHRFDGKFFVGVKTTGIYCRPICPAKPKRENVEFFTSALDAERKGYRPCLRCRPESAPLSPAWIGKSALVRRALNKLAQLGAEAFNEDEFAMLFGVSPRHLRRLFQDEIGKTPKQIFFENRLNLARQLLTETALSITEVAFASGFDSLRRFNSAFKERFKKSPSQIRRLKVKPSSVLSLKLSYRPPFDYEGLIHFYKSHRMGELEYFEDNKMFRVFALPTHRQLYQGTIAISNDVKNSQLILEIDAQNTAVIQSLVQKVRAMFDLDSDPVLVANSLEVNAELKKIVRKHPGIRLPSGFEAFEVAISSILGQFVSVDMGRSLVAQLINLLGSDSGVIRDGKAVKLFPTAAVIAGADLASIKTTAARKQSLKDFAAAVANEEISLDSAQDVDLFLKSVLKIKGIGPWTANYMAMKVLRHTDAFPATDLILARALELHPAELVEKMSPWRAYAASLFWREYAGTLKKTKASPIKLPSKGLS